MILAALTAAILQAAPAARACPIELGREMLDGRYDEAARHKVERRAGRAPVRWILPGSAVTQDWVPERLNLEVGDDGVVHEVRCG